jgi:hypothetical protein
VDLLNLFYFYFIGNIQVVQEALEKAQEGRTCIVSTFMGLVKLTKKGF